MKLLLDMNISPQWCDELRSRGFEAEHWINLGSRSASDAEILRFALSGSYVILTKDLDFAHIIGALGGNAPSVVQVRADDLSFEKIGEKIISGLTQFDKDLRAGAIVTISPNRQRVVALPIPGAPHNLQNA